MVENLLDERSKKRAINRKREIVREREGKRGREGGRYFHIYKIHNSRKY